jgi:hypothetical protein
MFISKKHQTFDSQFKEKIKMQKTKTLIALTLLVLLTVPIAMEASKITAQALDVPVYLKVHAEPSPIGKDQTIFISLFFTKPIPSGTYQGLTVNIVKPDGHTETFGPYTADTTGGVGGIEFTPTEVGNYTVQGFYPGQTITVSGTAYNILATESEIEHFTVQEEAIPGFPYVPLPTEYWSRPIYSTNFGWAALGGNWWGLYKPSFTDTGGYDAEGNNFNPYSLAPNSPHIMWVKQVALGGQPGLPISGDQESQYTSTSILYRQFEPVILNGVIYYKRYTNTPTTETSVETPGWEAVDLRTGETLWIKDTKDTLDFGMVMQFHTIQEYGSQAFLVGSWNSSGMFSFGAATNIWQVFDPVTGYFIANITKVPSTTATGIVDENDDNAQGAVLMYRVDSGNLVMWNSTRCLGGATSVTIRPSGNIDYTRGIQWTKPLPTVTGASLGVMGTTHKVILVGYYPQALSTFTTEFGEAWAIDAGMDAMTGDVLWGPINRTLPRFHEVPVVAVGGNEETGYYYVRHDKDTDEAYGYSLTDGTQLWGPVKIPGSGLSTLARGAAIAYGKVYIWDFGGYVSAIDLATGEVAWTLEPRSAGYDTPYGVYPYWHFGSHSLADGKLFLSESRMYDPPLFPNAHKMVINCTDGSVVWNILGFFGREPTAIADGYAVGYNSYDAQIYTFGKGPTQTTASVTQDVVPFGTKVLITGKVLDKSSGTTDNDRTARFPDGVAAVSEESQEAWMEYVYMQQLKPTDATGVEVTFTVIDANGNCREIGTAQSDASGFYSFDWMPDIDGKYTVYASFGGSESYWPSQATTAFFVSAEESTPAPTETPVSVADMYFVPAIAGIIVAIIVVGAVLALLLLKKRP